MPQKSSFGASMFQQKVPADEAMMMMVFVDTQKGALFFALLKSYRRTPPPRSKTTTYLARVPKSSSSLLEREVQSARETRQKRSRACDTTTASPHPRFTLPVCLGSQMSKRKPYIYMALRYLGFWSPSSILFGKRLHFFFIFTQERDAVLVCCWWCCLLSSSR